MKDFLIDFPIEGTKAVILGKGPTFSRWEDEKHGYQDHLICGINQASNEADVDIAFCVHYEPAIELRSQEALVMPYKPIYGWDQKSDKFLGDYQDILNYHNVYGYNVYWQGPTKYSESPHINGEGTTAHHIVDILRRKGVKEFVFFGVDGGKKIYGKQYYDPKFRLDDKKYFEQGKIPTDFDDFFQFFFRLRRNHGLKFTWI